jgi:hypothetical protein
MQLSYNKNSFFDSSKNDLYTSNGNPYLDINLFTFLNVLFPLIYMSISILFSISFILFKTFSLIVNKNHHSEMILLMI